MNLLIINLDKGIFSENSSSLARLKEYSQLVDKIFVIVWTTKKEKPIEFEEKLYIYPTNSCYRLFYFLDSFKLAYRILRCNAADVIFTQDPFETGLVGWLISKINKIPLQLQIHTDFLSPYFGQESFVNKIRVRLAKFLVPKATILRVVSERIKKSIVSTLQFASEKIFVLPIIVDVEKLRLVPITVDLHKKYPQFNFVVLMASRLSEEKNIGLAIDALNIIRQDYSKIGLIIVGNGPKEMALKEKVVRLNLQDNIKFESWTNAVASYYKTADVFLLTSNYEGYALSAAEAVSLGCPVVMTDVGCAGEIIKNEYNGLVIPVGDADKLVDALKRIIKDASLGEKIKLNGLDVVKKINSPKKYFEIYKKSWEMTAIKK